MEIKEKFISFLGDSITTFNGYSNNRLYNKDYNLCIPYYYNQIKVSQTYWMKLINNYHLNLLVNSSWSGSFLSRIPPLVGNDKDGTKSPGVIRVKNLSINISPDIIVIFDGINDLDYGIPVEVFAINFEILLKEIKVLYPNADVFIMNFPNRKNVSITRTTTFNSIIKNKINNMNSNKYIYVDLFSSSFKLDVYENNTFDGLHPNENGMDFLYKIIKEYFDKYYSI